MTVKIVLNAWSADRLMATIRIPAEVGKLIDAGHSARRHDP